MSQEQTDISNPPPSYEEAIRSGPSTSFQSSLPPLPIPLSVTEDGIPYYVQPRVVTIHKFKTAPSFDPYIEACPFCKLAVKTERVFRHGKTAIMICVIGIFFFPFLLLLYCNISQDAYHYCPQCLRLLSIKKRR